MLTSNLRSFIRTLVVRKLETEGIGGSNNKRYTNVAPTLQLRMRVERRKHRILYKCHYSMAWHSHRIMIKQRRPSVCNIQNSHLYKIAICSNMYTTVVSTGSKRSLLHLRDLKICLFVRDRSWVLSVDMTGLQKFLAILQVCARALDCGKRILFPTVQEIGMACG